MTGLGDSDESQIDVERQRAELAETVEELTHRVDVPARTKAAVHEKSDAAVELARRVDVPARTKAAVHEKSDAAVELARRRAPALAVVAGVGVVLIFLGAVRRRRRRRH